MENKKEVSFQDKIHEILEPIQHSRPKVYIRQLRLAGETVRRLHTIQDSYTGVFNKLRDLEKRIHEVSDEWKCQDAEIKY